MKHPPSDDPRLTTFALDEMSEVEREAFEAQLADQPETQAAVESVLATSALLREGFALELADVPVFKEALNVIRPAIWQRSGFWAAAVAVAAMVMLTAGVLFLVVQGEENSLAESSSKKADKAGELTTPAFRIEFRDLFGSSNEPEKAKPEVMTANVSHPDLKAQPELIPDFPPENPNGAPEPNTVASVIRNQQVEEALAHGSGAFTDTQNQKATSFPTVIGSESYPEVKDLLMAGKLPERDIVRVEELINHFDYGANHAPNSRNPVSIRMEVAACPWRRGNRLVHVSLRGWKPEGEISEETIAEKLSVLIDFNPDRVAEYRLIGFANPAGAKSQVNEGRILAGHQVTALYEVVPLETHVMVSPPSGTETKGEKSR